MIAERYILIILVSLFTLLFSLVLDVLLRPIPPAMRFFIQVPVLVIVMDNMRLMLHDYAERFRLVKEHVNGAFFFAAPLAALASGSLFKDMRSLLRLV